MVSPSTTRIDVRPLWRGSGVEIVATAWQRGVHPAACEVHAEKTCIEFMLAGSFRKESRSDAVVGNANNATVFQAGERFWVDHPAGASNAGVTIRFAPSAWNQPLLERGTWPLPAPAFAQISALATRLPTAEEHNAPVMEERVSALIGEVVEHAGAPPDAARDRAERDRVRLAQAFLNDVTDRLVSLTELACAVNWSPWHLVRAFQRHTGLSPYRYHLRLRLRTALRDLVRRRADLTQIALRAGFSSHSHFTAAFRREFGRTPSAMRTEGTRHWAGGTKQK